MFQRALWPLLAGVLLATAGCATFDTNTDDVVTFVFAQPTTECDVFLANRAIGRVSIANAAIGVTRSDEPLRIACQAAAHAPVAAEIVAVRTRDQSVGVLGVNLPTARALGARVVEPLTGPSPGGYPPRITIDIAQRNIVVPEGWRVKM